MLSAVCHRRIRNNPPKYISNESRIHYNVYKLAKFRTLFESSISIMHTHTYYTARNEYIYIPIQYIFDIMLNCGYAIAFSSFQWTLRRIQNVISYMFICIGSIVYIYNMLYVYIVSLATHWKKYSHEMYLSAIYMHTL